MFQKTQLCTRESRPVTKRKVARIRREIAQDTYISEAKLNAAIEALTAALLNGSTPHRRVG